MIYLIFLFTSSPKQYNTIRIKKYFVSMKVIFRIPITNARKEYKFDANIKFYRKSILRKRILLI